MNKLQKNRVLGFSFALALLSVANGYAQVLPSPTLEAKPGVR